MLSIIRRAWAFRQIGDRVWGALERVAFNRKQKYAASPFGRTRFLLLDEFNGTQHAIKHSASHLCSSFGSTSKRGAIGSVFCVGMILAGSPTVANDALVEDIYTQIEYIKSGNKELKALLVEQRVLLELIRENPVAAQKSLKPYSDCVNSVLKPYCPWFRASFAPEIVDVN